MSDIAFVADVAILVVMLYGAVWSVAFPDRRIWPPPGRGSWQHVVTWVGFWAVCGLSAVLLFLDWNSWIYLWIAHLLLALVFVVAPLTEEPWLEEQYGEAYREYRKRVPRFL